MAAAGLSYQNGEMVCPEGHQPTWEEVQSVLQEIAIGRGHLHGYPVPLDEAKLVVSKRFPFPLTNSLGRTEGGEEEEPDQTIVNSWFSAKLWRRVFVYDGEDGKRHAEVGRAPGAWQVARSLSILEAVNTAWRPEAEAQALATLSGHLSEQQRHCYAMTGLFLERSRRSDLFYVFRRLRPTLALSSRGPGGVETMRVIAALCLHPIAYYDGTWGGAMVPSDDVLAHLLLMRSDEALFWRRANQHSPWTPEAGIV